MLIFVFNRNINKSLKSPGESPAERCVIIGTAEYLLVWPHYLAIFAKRN